MVADAADSGAPLAGRPIIFTDLDGTLLDHHSYRYDEAARALDFVKAKNIPLIINSSKTFAEILPLQRQLGICQPFIAENGAAVYFPEQRGSETAWRSHAFAESRERVLSVLEELRGQGYRFKGFADGGPQEIAAMTGLSPTEAELAGQREFSEPLQWLGSEAEKQRFLAALKTQGLQAMQGGRFLTVCGDQPFDKGRALQWYCDRLEAPSEGWLVIALGDSPNDFPMLGVADVAVLVKADKVVELDRAPEGQLIRTQQRGPAGWQEAIDSLIPRLQLT